MNNKALVTMIVIGLTSIFLRVSIADDFHFADERASQLGPQADAYAMERVRIFSQDHIRKDPNHTLLPNTLRIEYDKARDAFISRWQPLNLIQLNDPTRQAAIQKHCELLVQEVWHEANKWCTEKSGRGAPTGTVLLDGNRKLSDYVTTVVYNPRLQADACFYPVVDLNKHPYARTIEIGPKTLEGRGKAGQFLTVAHELFHAICYQDQVDFAKIALRRNDPNISPEDQEKKAHLAARRSIGTENAWVYDKEERFAERWARAVCQAMIPGGLPPSLERESRRYVSGYASTMSDSKLAESEALTVASAYARSLRALRRSIGFSLVDRIETKNGRNHASEVFQKSIQGEPVFGGVVLGNRTSQHDLRVTGSKFRVEGNDVIVALTLEICGKRVDCEYQPSSPSDLWAAYHILQPKEEWQIRYGLDGTESSLVSMAQNTGNGAVEFALHPALIENQTGLSLALADAMFALSPPGLFEEVNVNLNSAQWHDAEPCFTVVDGRLTVHAATGPPGVLIRPSFWGLVDYDEQDMRDVAAKKDKIIEGLIPNIKEQYITAILTGIDDSSVEAGPARSAGDILDNLTDVVHSQNQRQPYSDSLRLITAVHHYRCLRDLNSFAKTLAVLNLIRDHTDELPKWPTAVEPATADTPSEALIAELEAAALLGEGPRGQDISFIDDRGSHDLWWRAPSAEFGGILISEEHYVDTPPVEISHQFAERKTMFAGAPAIEVTKTLQFNLEQLGVRVQEVFKVVLSDDDHRRPLSMTFERQIKGELINLKSRSEQPTIFVDAALLGKVSPDMQHVKWEVFLMEGRWMQKITVNGQVAHEEPCLVPNDQAFRPKSLSQSVQEFLIHADQRIARGEKAFWRTKQAVYDPMPVTETYSFRPSPVVDSTVDAVRKVQIKRVKTLSPLAKYGSILRDLSHREVIELDSAGVVKSWQIQQPPVYSYVEKNTEMSLLDHPHLKFMIETGRLFAINGESNQAKTNAAEQYRVLLPFHQGHPTSLAEARTKYFPDGPMARTDRKIDSHRVIKSLRLRFRFNKAPTDDWAHWDQLQQEVFVNDQVREVTILSPSHHPLRLSTPDSAWEIDFCSQPTPNIESTDPGIIGLAQAVQGNRIIELVHKLKVVVGSHLNSSYRFVGRPLSAAKALQLKEGACVEHAFLFAAMARSREIPTRIVSGLMYDEETSQFFPHAWNEVYLETTDWSGWYPCDPSFEDEVDARYIKLFHAADLDLPIDIARTPRGVFHSLGVESIEVIDVDFLDTRPLKPIRHIHFVKTGSNQCSQHESGSALQCWNAFWLGEALLLHSFEDSSYLSESTSVHLPEFASDFDLLLPLQVQHESSHSLVTRQTWFMHDALPAVACQFRVLHGRSVAAAFCLPSLLWAACLLEDGSSDRRLKEKVSMKLIEALQELGLPEPLLQEYQQHLNGWRNGDSDPRLIAPISTGVLSYLSKKAAEDHEAVDRELTHALQVTPDDSRLILKRAHQMVAQGASVEALELLQMLQPSDPNFLESRSLAGLCAMHKKRWAQATAAFSMALQHRPNDMDSMLHLARLDYETGRLGEALARIENALKLEPHHPKGWYLLAFFAAMEGERNRAIHHVQLALDGAPWDADTLMLFIRLLATDGISNLEEHQRLIDRLESLQHSQKDVAKREEIRALMFAVRGDFDSALASQDAAIAASSPLHQSRLKQQRVGYQRKEVSAP